MRFGREIEPFSRSSELTFLALCLIGLWVVIRGLMGVWDDVGAICAWVARL